MRDPHFTKCYYCLPIQDICKSPIPHLCGSNFALLSRHRRLDRRIPTVEHRPTRPGHLTPVFRHWERSVGMANEGVDWALSFADGAERADDGPDVNAQAPGPASTQRAGAKEKASQEPKTVRPRTRPVPACIHPRSRVFSHTTRPSPRTRAVSTTHPPRSPRCRHRPLFLARGSHSRLFPRRGGVPEPKNSPLTASLRTLPIVPQCRVKGCGATCHTVHEVRARACASHCAALYAARTCQSTAMTADCTAYLPPVEHSHHAALFTRGESDTCQRA